MRNDDVCLLTGHHARGKFLEGGKQWPASSIQLAAISDEGFFFFVWRQRGWGLLFPCEDRT
jgi:hypothetical protein